MELSSSTPFASGIWVGVNAYDVILEKLIFAQLVKTFSAFYETRRCITMFTRNGH